MARTSLSLQSGLGYFRASWPVDDLLRIYVSQSAPDYLGFDPKAVWLEIRGARGDFNIDRLDPADFTFRQSIEEGLPNQISAGSVTTSTEDGPFDSNARRKADSEILSLPDMVTGPATESGVIGKVHVVQGRLRDFPSTVALLG